MNVNYNIASPNFGMALRIKNTPKVAERLKEQPAEAIQCLKEAGEILKDTRFFHVTLGEDLVPRIIGKKGAYFGVSEEALLRRPHGVSEDMLVLDDVFQIERKQGLNPESAFNEYSVFSFPVGMLDRLKDANVLANIANELDTAAVEYLNKQAAITAQKQKTSRLVDSLLGEFGV